MAIIIPNRNVWRVEPATRVAVLVDGADYFQALRETFLQARRSILIVGWDLDSRTRLVGPSGKARDRYPVCLADFLSALAKRRPELTIQLLLWDYSVLYALEREAFPMVNLQWKTAKGVRLALDNCVPMGSSQHQKIIVVDDAVAFSGGLDVTIRRWDTPMHEAFNPYRVDPNGAPYRPFHDVQIMVDGQAAAALSELARARWRAATSEEIAPADVQTNPWPSDLRPHFSRVQVGIARTQPPGSDGTVAREVEQLFLDSIAAAERHIYIENQFLTAPVVAQALALRLRQRPELEALIVAPRNHNSWLAQSTMRNGRIRFMATLQEAGVTGRVRLAYPHVTAEEPTHTMVHSKVMVVDDRLLRVGSANLNKRSMGTDTECDLVIEAHNEPERQGILAVRNRLLAEHCGGKAEDVAGLAAQGTSLIEISNRLSRRGHSLRDIADGPLEVNGGATYIEGIADPEQPLEAAAFSALMGGGAPGHSRLRTIATIAGAALILIGLTLLWQFTPVAGFADPARIEAAMASVSESPWRAFIVVGAFVLGGLIAFPVNLLIAATAATFGPIAGFSYAAAGVMASAVVTYAVGAWLGREALATLIGPRLSRVRRQIARKGVLAVAAIRLVPIAPFTLVNMAAGAGELRLFDYLAGTALGMAPGLIVMSALGHQIFLVFTDPKPSHFVLLAAAVAVWLGLLLAVQAAIQRFRGRAS